MMPPALKDRGLGIADASMQTSSKDLMKEGKERANEQERSRGKVMAETLKEAALRGHPAAYGLTEVINALKEGRANGQFITKDFAQPGMICRSCNHIDPG